MTLGTDASIIDAFSKHTYEQFIKKNGLASGDEAERRAGVLKSGYVKSLLSSNAVKNLGINYVFRSHESSITPYYHEIDYVPKSMSIKAKTSNNPLVRGFIPKDPVLWKVDTKLISGTDDEKAAAMKEQSEKMGAALSAETEWGPLNIPLRQIVEGAEKEPFLYKVKLGEDKVSLDVTISKQAIEHSELKGLGEKWLGLSFRVDLKNILKDASSPDVGKNNTSFIAPSWWRNNTSLKEFSDEALNASCSISYSDSKEPRKLVEVLYDKNAKKPIASDADLLFVAVPIKLLTLCEKVLGEQQTKDLLAAHNLSNQDPHIIDESTSIVGKISKLETISDAIAKAKGIDNLLGNEYQIDLLRKKMLTENTKVTVSKTSCFETTVLGMVNTFEVTALRSANEAANKKVVQHGAENRNPGKLSNLDEPALHIMANGMTFLTRNEKELTSFLAKTDYLSNYFIDVNTQWKGDLWENVVQKQKDIAQQKSENSSGCKIVHEHLVQTNDVARRRSSMPAVEVVHKNMDNNTRSDARVLQNWQKASAEKMPSIKEE